MNYCHGNINDISNNNTLHILTKALWVELPPDRAYSSLPGLPLLQSSVQLLLLVDHIQAGGWGAWYTLHPELSPFTPLPWWKDGVQDLFCLLVLLSLNRRQLPLGRGGDRTTTSHSCHCWLLASPLDADLWEELFSFFIVHWIKNTI